jgi:hypothetical protein
MEVSLLATKDFVAGWDAGDFHGFDVVVFGGVKGRDGSKGVAEVGYFLRDRADGFVVKSFGDFF